MMNSNSNKQVLEKRYNGARVNLLLLVIFTGINIVLLLTESTTYFLFSAYIPYALVVVGMTICGMFPQEYYGENFSNYNFYDKPVFAVLLAIAIIIVGMYFVSWLLSKKNNIGWMIFSLIFFSVDTVGMFLFQGFETSRIADIVFHVWVVISLSLGIHACSKLKKISADEVVVSQENVTGEYIENRVDSTAIRSADFEVKSRVFIEAEVIGRNVIYRRVKKGNELIIDGNVYDEIESFVEFPHSLKAEIDGHLIEVGFDGRIHSYLKLDGEIVKKTLRLF